MHNLAPIPLQQQDPTKGPVIAAFTRDMVDTLASFFRYYEQGDIVRVGVTDRGLHIYNPHSGHWQFLGRAELTEAEKSAIRERRGPLA